MRIFHRVLAAVLMLSAAGPGGVGAAEVSFLGLAAVLPDAWEREQPANNMRQLQYRVPGDAGPAQFVVYYFGPGQGGSVAANIARWRSQFTTADGSPVTPTVRQFRAAGLPVTVASFTGRYARGIGTGPQGEALPEQRLLAAILESTRGPVIFQLHGPAATVSRQEAAFMELLRGLRGGS